MKQFLSLYLVVATLGAPMVKAQTWYKTGYNNPDDLPTFVAAGINGIFVTNHTKAYRSTNGGVSFTEVYNPGVSYGPHGIFCIADTLYMHRSVNYSRSTDNGATWTDLGGGHLTDRYVSADGNTIIVSGTITTATGYVSNNRGYTWSPLNFGASMNGFWGFGELNDSLACIGAQSGFIQNLYMSGDKGATWIEKTHNVPSTAGITGGVFNFTALDENAIVLSNDFMPVVHDGLFISNDYCNSFSPIITSPAVSTNSLLSRFRTYNEVLYLYGKDSPNGGFIYRSTDKGISWTEIADNLPNEEIRDLYEYNGFLYVTLRNSSNAKWEVWTTDMEGAGVGMNEWNAATKTLQVYPNPATDHVTINTNEKNASFDLYNVNMQKIMEIKPFEEKIDVSTLDAGVYFLKSTGSNQNLVGKFVIAR